MLDAVERISDDPTTSSSAGGPDPATIALWLEAQLTSRLLDHTARWLRSAHGVGHYTIGSAGHEANAIVATATRWSDPALLHYRSGGFFAARAMQAPRDLVRCDVVGDVLRGVLAKATEPIASGRHKVFGNRSLSIIPQTSTIASHLPRAVGLAISFELAPPAPTTWPGDSVVVASIGDGSLDHSTAQGAINWAGRAVREGRRVPLLLVCEDNGLGLSVPSPTGWVADSMATRDGWIVAHADGADPAEVRAVSTALVDEVRERGRPGFLHLSTVRFLGHAGTDVESAYRSPSELAADLERDPIVGTARLAAVAGVSTPAETVAFALDLRESIRQRAIEVLDEPELVDVEEVMAPLRAEPARRRGAGVRPAERDPSTSTPARAEGDGSATSPGLDVDERSSNDPLTLARTINRSLADLLAESDDVVVFGEDVARKGGVYGVTRGLHGRFGADRVLDTLLDEQSILGLALGAALNGRLPIPEIQYLAYLHNAEDQLRGEAASLAFFSQRRYLNPMVVRIAGYGYQKGFGGHFHNDDSIAVLRDVPGLVIASPGHPADAAGVLLTCVDHARGTGAVCVVVEPIARYHDGDLHAPGDGGWSAPYDPTPVPIGRARVHAAGHLLRGAGHDAGDDAERDRDGRPRTADLTIVSFANGVHLSLRAARRLARDHGIAVDVVDLRWIAPLPIDDLLDAASRTGRVLVVDETRRTGGVGEGIVAELVDARFAGPIGRVASHDSYVPLGAAAELVLVSEGDVVAAALEVVERGR